MASQREIDSSYSSSASTAKFVLVGAVIVALNAIPATLAYVACVSGTSPNQEGAALYALARLASFLVGAFAVTGVLVGITTILQMRGSFFREICEKICFRGYLTVGVLSFSGRFMGLAIAMGLLTLVVRSLEGRSCL